MDADEFGGGAPAVGVPAAGESVGPAVARPTQAAQVAQVAQPGTAVPPWSGIPYPYIPPPASPLPPRRPRIPKRHLLGAALAGTIGLALAVFSIASARTGTAKPVPPSAAQLHDEAVRAVWRTTPVDTLLPQNIDRTGGEKYVRLGVAEPADCEVLPSDFRSQLAADAPGTTCVKVLRATYTDSTQTVLATVGIVVIDGPPAARDKVWRQWTPSADARRPSLMPGVFPVPATPAAKFADAQRVVWSSQTSDDGSYLVYAVSGFLDGRAGSTPDQLRSGAGKALAADSPPVQAAVDLPGTFVDALKAAGAGS